MRTLRPIFIAVMAIVVLLTSQSMAVARGTTHDAAGVMILCTGDGTVSVLYDENGAPIAPAHICPDCAIGFVDFVESDVKVSPAFGAVSVLDGAHMSPQRGSVEARKAVARGPPLG